MTKIKAKGNQLFNVPDDADGQKFLGLVKKYRQEGVAFRYRKKKEVKTNRPFYSIHIRSSEQYDHHRELINKLVEKRDDDRETIRILRNGNESLESKLKNQSRILQEKTTAIDKLSARIKYYEGLGLWGLFQLWRKK